MALLAPLTTEGVDRAARPRVALALTGRPEKVGATRHPLVAMEALLQAIGLVQAMVAGVEPEAGLGPVRSPRTLTVEEQVDAGPCGPIRRPKEPPVRPAARQVANAGHPNRPGAGPGQAEDVDQP